MREDMQEVLITRGRRGSAYRENETIKRLRRTKINEDDVGGRASIRPHVTDVGWDAKHHNKGEHLAPLKRYLRSQVGRKWDDVYSEICKNNPKDSAVGAHIYQHLERYVELHPVYKDGIYYPEYSWQGRLPLGGYREELYVDIEGVLRLAPYSPQPEITKDYSLLQINNLEFLVRNKKGIWFHLLYSTEYEEYLEKYQDTVWEPIEQKYIKKSAERLQKKCKYRQIHLNSDHFELLPFKEFAYGWDPYRNEIVKKRFPNGFPYLIKAKQLSTEEKKQWNIQ